MDSHGATMARVKKMNSGTSNIRSRKVDDQFGIQA
jgi:hypothetical protein